MKSSSKWPVDANSIDPEDSENILYSNHLVDTFLNDDRKFIVCANKGVGKTLLLTCKRHKVYTKHHHGASGLVPTQFVPKDRPYLDCLSDISSLSATSYSLLKTIGDARMIWEYAIKLSAITNAHLDLSDDDLKLFPDTLQELIREGEETPTGFLTTLLSGSSTEIRQRIADTISLVNRYFRRIHNGIAMFIDKVDQALAEAPRSTWVNGQAGLAEAIYNCNTQNPHIKVYASIRQEAFSSYSSPIKTNVIGLVVSITYTKHELESLLNKLSKVYEKKKSFKDFVGFAQVDNKYNCVPEDTFDYLHRHSVGRPRDLVEVCSQLSVAPKPIDSDHYRVTVNQATSDNVARPLFDEMAVFLDWLKPEKNRYRLFAALHQNILTHGELLTIGRALSQQQPVVDDTSQSAMDLKPLQELYNIGLLGYAYKNLINNRWEQCFKQASDGGTSFTEPLPEVTYYVIHPSLHDVITKSPGRDRKYLIYRYLVTGHQRPWPEHYACFIDIQSTKRHLSPEDPRRVHIDELLGAAHRLYSSGEAVPEIKRHLQYNPSWQALKDAHYQNSERNLEFALTHLVSGLTT